MSATKSIIETAYEDLIAEIQAIKVSGGYRNTLKNVGTTYIPSSQATDLPHAIVIFNDEMVDAVTSHKEVFQERVETFIVGYIEGSTEDKLSNTVLVDNAESLIHDFKRALATFMLKYQLDNNKKYFIDGKEGMLHFYRVLPTGQAKGEIGVRFIIKVLAADKDF